MNQYLKEYMTLLRSRTDVEPHDYERPTCCAHCWRTYKREKMREYRTKERECDISRSTIKEPLDVRKKHNTDSLHRIVFEAERSEARELKSIAFDRRKTMSALLREILQDFLNKQQATNINEDKEHENRQSIPE